MSNYIPLTLRYRPQRWGDLAGQEVVVQTLCNMLRDGRIIPSLIFGGSRGTGKTTTARILAKALNCPNRDPQTFEPCGTCQTCEAIRDDRHMSVQEMDAASHGLVDDVRRIREEVRYVDTEGGFRVYIIDECHSLTDKAWQAFLKVLEEPPPNTVFTFCTTEVHKIPETIISRSANFSFARMTNETLVKRLTHVAGLEQIKVVDGVFAAIARHVNGGMRDAISLLDQLVSYSGGQPINLAHVRYVVGTINEDLLFALCKTCFQADLKETYTLLQQAYTQVSNITTLVTDLAMFYRDLMMTKIGVAISDTQSDYGQRLAAVAAALPLEYLLHCQTELAILAQKMGRTQLPERTVLDINIPRLFYGGIRSSTQFQAPVAPAQPTKAAEVLTPTDLMGQFDASEVAL